MMPKGQVIGIKIQKEWIGWEEDGFSDNQPVGRRERLKRKPATPVVKKRMKLAFIPFSPFQQPLGFQREKDLFRRFKQADDKAFKAGQGSKLGADFIRVH